MTPDAVGDMILVDALAGLAEAVLRDDKGPDGPDAKNTYGLPEGGALRAELVAWFKKQRAAALAWLPPPTAPLPESPPDFTDWDDPMSAATAPILAVYWDDAGKETRSSLGLDPGGWSVSNPEVKKKIESASLDFCESTNATTSQQIGTALKNLRAALAAGIAEQGETLEQLTKRVNGVFDGAEKWRARRVAATEASRAAHAGQQAAAEASGVVAGYEWLVSEDACPLCKKVATEARRVKLGQAFAVVGSHAEYSQVRHPPLHPGCCLPETPVVAPLCVAGMTAQYDGPVIRIDFVDGSHVTVTPNHMLLTPEGFAVASGLVDGDDVIRHLDLEPPTGRHPDHYGKPVPIKQVVEALAVSGGMTTARVPVAAEYLHGDASFCQGHVDVVSPDGLLLDHFDSTAPDPAGELLFGGGREPGPSTLPSERALAKVLLAIRDATDGGVGGLRERQARCRVEPRHSQRLSIAATPNIQAGVQETSADGVAGHTQGQGNGLL